jgi:cytochrome c oxidase subunit 2
LPAQKASRGSAAGGWQERGEKDPAAAVVRYSVAMVVPTAPFRLFHRRSATAGSWLAFGPSSAVDTAGRDAAEIATLFWWMTAGAVVIWAGMTALALYCAWGPRRPDAQKFGTALIVGGGVAFPVAVLTALLVAGLPALPRVRDRPPTNRRTIAVAGEQWWWRVRYPTADGGHVELANEIRLPVGERVAVQLSSDNVIHSFWIPSLAGKIDMIPGRRTQLSLEPTRTGTFRGVCAEYCGTAHALMAFPVAVLEPRAFEAWLAAEQRPAQAPVTESGRKGEALFAESGCGACHTVRGTGAAGTVGPDLTHVGGRTTLGAATVPNEDRHRVEWLADPGRLKPGTHMPAFAALGDERLQALAAYLRELK